MLNYCQAVERVYSYSISVGRLLVGVVVELYSLVLMVDQLYYMLSDLVMLGYCWDVGRVYSYSDLFLGRVVVNSLNLVGEHVLHPVEE